MKGQQELALNQAENFVQQKSDRLMDFFLAGFYLIGIVLAFFYDTWMIAFGIGGLCLIAYYSTKIMLPDSTLYQFVLGAILGVFMAQFIYQMHGLFEMHFFAFIGSAILITYQKWKLQIPLLVVVFVHHSIFSYLQNTGADKVYFTQLNYFDNQTFIIHLLLTAFIFFISGLWAYQLKTYNQKYLLQALQIAELSKEALLSNERKQYADSLKQLNTELEQQAKDLLTSNADLEQFAYVASHDLQEPLRMVSSFLNRLEKKYDAVLDEKGKSYIHFAADGAHRMRQIINDLLEYSRAGKTPENLEQVDLQDMVTQITCLLAEQITEQGAKIYYNNLPTLSTLKTPIWQVFQNLITNALKYHAPGRQTLVNIGSRETDGLWEFSVTDNGIGINPEDFESIFVIFQRLHTREEYSGTGIGLATTKKIIQKMNGSIWLSSEPGKGTTFYFSIPKYSTTTNLN